MTNARITHIVALGAVVLFSAPTVAQTTYRVDANATTPLDGSTWCNAFADLRSALVAAVSGDTILVADGSYYPDDGQKLNDDRLASFVLENGVDTRGGYAGCDEAFADERDIEVYVSILSGDINQSGTITGNSWHVVVGSGTNSTAVLEGFTIRDGNADGTFPEDSGAGIYIDGGSPTITSCTIRNNRADGDGAGMFNDNFSAPTVSFCDFIDNQTTAGNGGGVQNSNSSAGAFLNCTFVGNSADESGGGMINAVTSDPLVTNCRFEGNTALENGGGMANTIDSLPTINGCVFEGNMANGLGGGFFGDDSDALFLDSEFIGNSANWGGGMWIDNGSIPKIWNSVFRLNSSSNGGGAVGVNQSSDATFENCAFYGNVANGTGTAGQPHGGGAVMVKRNTPGTGSHALFINCTFGGNSSTGTGVNDGGGAFMSLESEFDLDNCVLWGNSDANGSNSTEHKQIKVNEANASSTLNHSIIEGWTGGSFSAADTATTGDDPLFVAPSVGDFRLRPGSPAIDSGDTTAIPDDIGDLDNDFNTTEPTSLTIDGPRLLDDPDTVDGGVADGGLPIVDRGVHEFFIDCDDSGLPDPCDIDCAGLAGVCTGLVGCGLAFDCQPNGIPDACDINPTDPDGNGLVSEDCSNTNIPDECADPGAPDCFDATANGDFSAGGTWDGGMTPGVDDSAVVGAIGGGAVTVTMDVDATVAALRVLDEGTLDQTGMTVGDLIVDEPEGVYSNGTIVVAHDRTMSVPIGPVRIVANGAYVPDAGATVAITSSLSSDTLSVEKGACTCPDGFSGGLLQLTDEMNLTTTGDLNIIGSDVVQCTPCSAPRGGITPTPKFAVIQQTGSTAVSIDVGGDLRITGNVDVNLNPDIAPNRAGGITPVTVFLGGSFVNHSVSPQTFDWTAASLVLDGMATQSFELASNDVGAGAAGFVDNFAMGTIDVGNGTTVEFVDDFDNSNSGAAEALFVDNLILRSGSEIVLNNTNAYYNTLDDQGGTITIAGDARLSTGADCNNNSVPDEFEVPDPSNRVDESFDDVAGIESQDWFIINNSDPVGLASWFQGNDEVFRAHSGAGSDYVGANFNSTADGTISNWLISPLRDLQDGMVFSFVTRTTTGSPFPDRLEVRMSQTSAAPDVGGSAESVGQFSTLLASVNPNLDVGGYPENWTLVNATVTGVPTATPGRLALRYYVTDGGPTGTNSNFIGVDSLSISQPGDCNTNGVPDFCDPDGDGDNVPDDCDQCGGADDNIDNNNNAVPDACDIQPPLLASPPHDILKNRYISIDPRGTNDANVGRNFDIQVTLVSTQVNGVTAVGSSWWVGEPDAECIAGLQADLPASPPNWDACPTLHLTGCAVIPTSTYDVTADDGAGASASALAADTQAKPGPKFWGDVVGTFDAGADQWLPPNTTTNIDDAVAGIKTFQDPTRVGPGCGSPPCNATHVSVTDLQPHGDPVTPFGAPNRLVNIADVFGIILGFQGNEFPGPAIDMCP